MSTPDGLTPRAKGERRLAIQVGRTVVTGTRATLMLVLLLALFAALLVWARPSLRMLLSGALWVLFVVYWAAAAKGAAPTQSSETTASRAVHTRLMHTALLLLFVPVPYLRGRLLPLTSVVLAIGFTIQVLGFLLAIWARRHLGRNWSGAITVTRDHQLIRSGPYRRVRHPIYTAMIGMMLGTAIVSGEVHALLGLLVIAGAYGRKIGLEERNLRLVFGPAYDAYRNETRALIPFLL